MVKIAYGKKLLEKFRDLITREKTEGIKPKTPKHVAVTTDGIIKWAKLNKIPPEETYKKSNLLIRSTIKTQVKLNIPILTIYLLPSDLKEHEYFSVVIDSIIELFKELSGSETINKNMIKISVLGKWYDLPGRAVEIIKSAIDETKDYDHFFLNFCINYDGHEEIVDACKLIARQIKADKIDVDAIDKDIVKENIYSSYFLPPDLIIKNGKKNVISGLLLWDSINAKIFFTEKLWPDFGKSDFIKALEIY